MFSKAKDKMIETALRRMLEERLDRYGKVQSLKVDSKNGSATLGFLPSGEDKPLEIRLEKYGVRKTDDGIAFQLKKVTSDRMWVSNLLEDFAEGREFKITGAAAKMAEWIL